jgi:predicted dehydrogenase
MKVLIIGLGSIGKRHISVIKKLQPQTKFYALRSSKKSIDYKDIVNLNSWDEIDKYNFDFSIISSPSSLHLDHIEKLSKYKLPVFVEKPLCVNKSQLKKININKFHALTYVALNMRFHPLIIYLKNFLNKSDLKIYEINAYYGSYMPSWRSGNHRNTYSSNKELGGGVHLDLIHEPDLLHFLFGLPKKIHKSFRKVSNITIDSIDFSNLIFEYEDFSAIITLNYFRKDKKRVMEIVTDKNTLEVDFTKGTIMDLHINKKLLELKGDLMTESYERQMKFWLDSLKKKNKKINNLLESKELLNMIL